MAKSVSQIQKINKFLAKKGKEGVTVSTIAHATKVPKTNILPHIAMLRSKFNAPIVTERRDTKAGGRKVYFVYQGKAA